MIAGVGGVARDQRYSTIAAMREGGVTNPHNDMTKHYITTCTTSLGLSTIN